MDWAIASKLLPFPEAKTPKRKGAIDTGETLGEMMTALSRLGVAIGEVSISQKQFLKDDGLAYHSMRTMSDFSP